MEKFYHRSKNIGYTTYYTRFLDGEGVNHLKDIFIKEVWQSSSKRNLYQSGELRIRFFIYYWVGYCRDARFGCEKHKFLGWKDKDVWQMAQHQPLLNPDNFSDKYGIYMDRAYSQAEKIYKMEVCPRCPTGEIVSDIKEIAIQIIKRV